MKRTLGIVGASGYGGAELLRLADAHPGLEVAVVAAHSAAGQDVDALFPNTPRGRAFDDIDVDVLGDLDVVALATPHGPALDLAVELLAAGTRVVDLSAAYRLTSDGFKRWYGASHPHPDLAPAVYGLPELDRTAIPDAQLVANPGCYPTAALLGLAPLVELLEPGTVVIDAMSGTSGAGRGTADHLHFAHVHGGVAAYGVAGHRHTGEIEQQLEAAGGELGPIQFTPHLLPTARGLLATASAVLHDEAEESHVRQALTRAYAHEPFVEVLAEGRWPTTKAVHGANGCQVAAAVDARTRRVVVSSAIDNLGKGAAGQALQNINLLLGLDETAGLTAVGVYP